MRFLARGAIRLVSGALLLLLLQAGEQPTRSMQAPAQSATRAAGQVISEVAVKEPLVALTFDDGPNPTYTPQILELLSKYQARATFFVLGEQVEKYPELVTREARQGNQVGNHGYHHLDLRQLKPNEVLADLHHAETLIQNQTGRPPTVFRPPLGKYQPQTVALVQGMGYRFVLWTWATNSDDSWKNPSADAITKRILEGVRPGAIILLHDHGGNRRPTVAAAARVLEELTQRGYRFVTLDELLAAST